MAQRTNLFRRLTSLFRSGPIVKRKIQGFRTGEITSSALDVFRKSTAGIYGNALNAYGQYDRLSRYSDFSEMEYCLHGDTKIAVPNGYKTIRELAEEYGVDKEFVVYAFDHNTGCITPALGKQARKTRTDHAWKVTFDNGQEIIGTANHRLMKRDGTFCKIESLQVGDSMMPFVRKDFYSADGDAGDGYRWVYTIGKGYVKEHKLVAEWAAGKELQDDECVHHINYKKWDNRPENLRVMTVAEHTTLHNNADKWAPENAEWTEKFKKQHSAWMRENNPAERKDITFGRIIEACENIGFNLYRLCEAFDTDPNVIKRRLRENGYADFKTFAAAYCPDWKSDSWDNKGRKNPRFKHDLTFQRICDVYQPGKSLKKLSVELGVSVTPVMNRLRENGFESFYDFKNNYRNHKVVSIEYYGFIDLYDLTVDGYKNFATDSVISHNTPEIASALDIHAEEAVAPDDKGRSVHIYADNPKIQQLLEELFYDTLNVEFNLKSWVRNLCKYGDFFLFNDVSPEYGVINAFPIPVNEIEREEGYDPNDPLAVRFRWVTQGNQVLENWQVTHFRLLGNDAFLPYGASILESARRIWRQLILIEDAMLVYRVIRAPERRVFYIDVANVPPTDVPNVIEQARAKLKSQEVIDKDAGRVDLRYNPWSVDIDYFLPVRGGETGTKIDTLPGGQNTTAIDDVEYIQRKLFAALKVPKAYLGFDEQLSSKANLAQEDVRFARTINAIQRVIISELNKIATIHLFANGYEDDDLLDFTIQLSNPSTVAMQQKLELIRTKFEIASSKPEFMLSTNWIYKNVFNMTDDQIEDDMEEMIADRTRQAQLDQMGEGGGGPGGGGGGGLGGLGGPEPGGLEDLGGEGGEDLGLGGPGGEELPGEDLGGEEGGEEEEPEEDLFAGEEGDKKEDLLLDDEEPFELDDEDDEEKKRRKHTPIKPQSLSQIQRFKHNRQRRVHGRGRSQTAMPDLSGMNQAKAFSDVNDKRHQRNPFGEGGESDGDVLSNMVAQQHRMSRQLERTLNSMKDDISIPKKQSVLTEDVDEDELPDVVFKEGMEPDDLIIEHKVDIILNKSEDGDDNGET